MRTKQLLKTSLVLTVLFLAPSPGSRWLYAQDCKAKVNLISNRDNSLFFVDSVLIGKGNASTELSKGNHILVIKESLLRWGDAVKVDTLRIQDCAQKYLFSYELKDQTNMVNQELPFGTGNQKSEESFFKSGTLKLLIGSAALLGGISAYFKIQADRKYDDYLKSKNQTLLDEVNRLDAVSGISFGLLQLNFGYLIYKFLTD